MNTPRRPNRRIVGATVDEAFLLGMVYNFAATHASSMLRECPPFKIIIATGYFRKAHPNVPRVIAHCHHEDQREKICVLRGHITVFNLLHEIGHIIWRRLSDTFKTEFSATSLNLYGEKYYPDPKFGLGHDGFIRDYSRRNAEECFCDFWAACIAYLYYQIFLPERPVYNP